MFALAPDQLGVEVGEGEKERRLERLAGEPPFGQRLGVEADRLEGAEGVEAKPPQTGGGSGSLSSC